MKNIYALIVGGLLFAFSGLAQTPTVGTLFNTATSQDGYTLFCSINSTQTYLINNCGQVVNTWYSTTPPGLSAYLWTDGTLYRSKRILNANMSIGGLAGGIERLDWSGNVLWSYRCSGPDSTSHHDFKIMPNGNILLLVTYAKQRSEAEALGRDSINNDSLLFSESILEIEPIGVDSGRIVWAWHAWDHLIQDRDSVKPNFGIVAQHPERMNINYIGTSSSRDWLHSNSIDYHPTLDQIVIGFRNTNEFWIIDHSTSTAEAAGNTGGRYGRGGDILYRWGNPASHDAGTSTQQRLFGQHGVCWVPDSFPGGGHILLFNNGDVTGVSSVEELIPPIDSAGFYTQPQLGQAFGPAQLYWSYQNSSTIFNSGRLSSSERLPNGNTLVCSGNDGYFTEVDSNGTIVWAYRNPVTGTGILSQGATVNSGVNSVFSIHRYLADYPGFLGQNLTPSNPIELNFDISHCQIYNNTTTEPGINKLKIYPNPTQDIIFIESAFPLKTITVHDAQGRVCWRNKFDNAVFNSYYFETSKLSSGFYIIVVDGVPYKIQKI